ncbi:hypothetical protein E1A91_D03G111500v1 [Gossypium mustelinum]|uniref:Uncharacterized protein n=1 Tax=Gossypium mustelinum TaxID=34275 RepID=A0A5D2VLN0_GOSMU|nr:hypothetical protein E1A91_D03G111500v1 [Gossypium mustelinum]
MVPLPIQQRRSEIDQYLMVSLLCFSYQERFHRRRVESRLGITTWLWGHLAQAVVASAFGLDSAHTQFPSDAMRYLSLFLILFGFALS